MAETENDSIDITTPETSAYIIICCVIGLAWAWYNFRKIASISIGGRGESTDPLTQNDFKGGAKYDKVVEVYEAIEKGAKAFLKAEYTICAHFIVVFSVVIFVLVGVGSTWTQGGYTTFAFILGACTSILCGYIGMRIAVFSNARTTIAASRAGWTDCFNVAFRAGAVMGFTLVPLAILVMYMALAIFRRHWSDRDDWETMMDCISGYGLGGSGIALFGRVGGGIYTKAADVGADLVGKVIRGIPEDDPRNPATIADNVGDNVGDVAGMGADLFGSFAESTCAAMVIATSAIGGTTSLGQDRNVLDDSGWSAIMFPLAVSSTGILVCLVCSLLATHIQPVKKEQDIEKVLKLQLISTCVVLVPLIYLLASEFLPDKFHFTGVSGGEIIGTPTKAWAAISSGTIGGLVIGIVTEYYTSHTYKPVREVAYACKTGAATNIIYGLALGYKSVIIPVFILASIIFISFKLVDLYGVALAAIGMLANLSTGLTIDAYGPVCDNAGGIAEMAQLEPEVREKTDALDAAGNTTAAIGKGFAIGSAALVSLALYGAFVTRLEITDGVNILEPITFAFLLIGAMLPYWFSAMTMKSVGLAAMQMVVEIQRQYTENPALLDENATQRPDYDRCIQISTQASLKEMVPPGALVMLAPLLAGTFFGEYAVFGLLTGGLVSGVQMAISMSNTGGAWDNAKKFVERATPGSELQGKGSDIHKAAVVGDTVGDPMKDTSGPSLNILMKLMAIISLVFAEYFKSINNGRGVFNINVQS